MEWVQGELFDFADPECFIKPTERKKKHQVDYQAIYEELKKGPLSFSDIYKLSGAPYYCVNQVITTLSLRYPIYECGRGMFKLYGDDDYGDGINHSAINMEDY